jgi:hypothetical protein
MKDFNMCDMGNDGSSLIDLLHMSTGESLCKQPTGVDAESC